MIEASIDAATWVTVIKTDSITFSDGISAVLHNGRYTRSQFDSLVSFFHETTHFWHSVSTNFLHEYSCSYLHESLYALSQIRMLNSNIQYISHYFENSSSLLKSPLNYPIQSIDIIEGSAVFNSYRICVFEPSHNDFLRFLHDNYAKLPKYNKAYYYAKDFLEEATFELFCPLCYVALQYPDPGKYFSEMILKIHSFKLNNGKIDFVLIQKDPLAFILNIMNISADDHLLPFLQPYFKKGNVSRHPILRPFIEYILNISQTNSTNIRWVEDMFARPYYHIRNNFSTLPKIVMENLFFGFGGQTTAKFIITNDFNKFKIIPPIRVHVNPKDAYETRYGQIEYGNQVSILSQGLTNEDDEYNLKICNTTVLLGILQAIQINDRDNIELLCPHNECPIYKTKLCIKYYFFPQNNYRDCEFSDLMRAQGLNLLIK